MAIRGLADLLADLDTRSRIDPPGRNKVINKAVIQTDIVYLSDSIITTVDSSFPKVWAGGSAASTGFELIVGMGQYE